jgi:hypothetical protein
MLAGFEEQFLSDYIITSASTDQPEVMTMVAFRYRTATLVGNWCDTEEAAMEDAARARQAHRTDKQEWCWIVPGVVEERKSVDGG